MISPDWLRDLMAAGDRGGRIDTLLKEQKCRARTMQVYLASVRKFLEWLSSDSSEFRTCNLTCEQVEQVRARCGMFVRSLNDDVAQEAIDESCRVCRSQVVKDATNLAFEAKDKLLSQSDRVLVRDTLYLALTLDQIRRAGDLNCITVEQAQAACPNIDHVGGKGIVACNF